MKKNKINDGHILKNYLGKTGAGKTLSTIERDFLPAYLSGVRCKSNIFINLKGVEFYTDLEECVEDRNCFILCDEVGDMIDAYDWRTIPQSIKRMFRFHRKRHLDFVMTAQDISFIAKPFRVLIKTWVFCEEDKSLDIFDNTFLRVRSVRFKYRELIQSDLSGFLKGLGSDPLEDKNDVFSKENSSNENLSDINVIVEPFPVKKVSYSFKHLLHRELNEFKIELVHRYCPDCKSRQGEQILNEHTLDICDYVPKTKKYYLKNDEFCPYHKETLLEVRESGIYDSDFEIIPPFVEGKWVYMVKVSGSPRFEPYRGVLTPEMLNSKPS